MNHRLKYLLPILVGIIALFIPLVRDFHIESAMIAATVGAFWAGLSATKHDIDRRGDVHRAIAIIGSLYLAGLPLLVNALVSGCYTVHGLGFWLFFPIPSVFFGYAIGRLMRKFGLPFPKTLTTVILLLVAVGILVYEFFNFSQLYFFNHVWGGWPGPIYDETIQLDFSVIGFRFITFCWILILWFIPGLKADGTSRWLVGLAVAGLLVSYMQLVQMGIVSPDGYLQQQLGGVHQTEHARIYYDDDSFGNDEIRRIGEEIEFYIDQIKEALLIDRPDSDHRIEIYLYAHPWQKKELVGAKYTSYVTVWREIPQIHIAKGQLEGSLKHEVVHAVTALLEEPGLLPNVGLTEGIAVALDPDRSSRSTIDQLVAAQKPYPTKEEMESALSYWGFYTGRSAVSYTTTGSFVRYLIESHPPEYFVAAYETGNLTGSYPESLDELVRGWHRKLDSVEVDSSDRQRASEIFGRLSLFEKRCPHKIPRSSELFDQFLLYEAESDTTRALASLAELKELKTEEPLPKLLWLSWNLQTGNVEKIVQQADRADTLIEAQLFYSDAYQLNGQPQNAEEHLYRAVELASEKNDTTFDEQLAIRLDSLQWRYDFSVRYDHQALNVTDFRKAYYLTKIRSLRNAIEQEDVDLVNGYADLLYDLPTTMEYFSTYISIIHRLGYYRNFKTAEAWIQKLYGTDLGHRQRERLQQELEWINWLSAKTMQGP